MKPRYLAERWRIGRSLGRTIYVQLKSEPSGDDLFLGIMDSTEFAKYVVGLHNATLEVADD